MSSGPPDRSDDMVESRPKTGLGRNKGNRSSRIWGDAIEKRDREGCRLADHPLHACDGSVQAAHTVGRKYDWESGIQPNVLYVHPDSIVPLCAAGHREYDAHRLDLLPWMTLDEQADAVKRVGIVRAIARLTGARRPGWQSTGLVASQPNFRAENLDSTPETQDKLDSTAGLVASQPQQVEEEQ